MLTRKFEAVRGRAVRNRIRGSFGFSLSPADRLECACVSATSAAKEVVRGKRRRSIPQSIDIEMKRCVASRVGIGYSASVLWRRHWAELLLASV